MKWKHAMLLPAVFAFGTAASAGEPVDNANLVTPLLVGMQVPEVTMKLPDGSDLALKDAVTGKPTILIFYRGSW